MIEVYVKKIMEWNKMKPNRMAWFRALIRTVTYHGTKCPTKIQIEDFFFYQSFNYWQGIFPVSYELSLKCNCIYQASRNITDYLQIFCSIEILISIKNFQKDSLIKIIHTLCSGKLFLCLADCSASLKLSEKRKKMPFYPCPLW